jgi:hypothetical protein
MLIECRLGASYNTFYTVQLEGRESRYASILLFSS